MVRASNSLRAAVSITMGLIVMLAASACTTAGQDPASGVTLPEKNLERWVLPLDSFLITRLELKKSAYVNALLLQDCAAGKGFQRVVPYIDIDAVYGGEAVVREQLTPETAAKVGYRSIQTFVPPGAEAWEAYVGAPRTQAENDAIGACWEEVGKSIPHFENKVLNFTSGLANAAASGALVDPTALKAAERWSTCMKPKGIEDLPGSPNDMPSDSIAQRFHIASSIDHSATAPVSAEEIDLAVFDAQCRETSGYRAALYKELWERETSLLEDNYPALQELAVKIKTTNAKMDRVIATHAGGNG